MSRGGYQNQKAGAPDHFQTPAYAIEPLYKYIPNNVIVYDPCYGKGNIVKALNEHGIKTIYSDINDEDYSIDFLTIPEEVTHHFDILITNPPYSLKDEFLEQCYFLGKPFALLMPLTGLEGQVRQALYKKHGLKLILLNKRVNFELASEKKSSAWFPVGWFTHDLINSTSDLFFEDINTPEKEEKPKANREYQYKRRGISKLQWP